MLRRLELVMVRGTRTLCPFDRLQKFRCVRTVSTPNFVLTRRTGEAAASRRTLRGLRDLCRIAGHGIASAAVQAMLVSATRSEAAAFATARYRVMLVLSTLCGRNCRERLRSPCRGPPTLTS